MNHQRLTQVIRRKVLKECFTWRNAMSASAREISFCLHIVTSFNTVYGRGRVYCSYSQHEWNIEQNIIDALQSLQQYKYITPIRTPQLESSIILLKTREFCIVYVNCIITQRLYFIRTQTTINLQVECFLTAL